MLRSQEIEATSGPEVSAASRGNAGILESSSSPVMRAVERMIAHIATTNIPVLLIGESGTGKEFIAQQVHRLSTRRNKAFVKEICASLASASLTAHFGHNCGSNFVQSGNNGRNDDEGSGTVFLKEVGELDPVSQRNLLYSLPAGDGGSEARSTGPRVISSTALNLEAEMRAGRFRPELYYRINGACLRLPPLRQRREDIPSLVDLFLAKHTSLQEAPRPRLDAHDFALLQAFPWPGNIRELENVVKKIVALGDPKMVLSDLVTVPTEPSTESRSSMVAANGSTLKAATRAASRGAERQLILDALTKTRWNRKRAAQELQISYKSLLYKLKQIGAEEPQRM